MPRELYKLYAVYLHIAYTLNLTFNIEVSGCPNNFGLVLCWLAG